MTYTKPSLRSLDLDASFACCGAHGGGCHPPPPNSAGDQTSPGDSGASLSDASVLVGILGCYAMGTC